MRSSARNRQHEHVSINAVSTRLSAEIGQHDSVRVGLKAVRLTRDFRCSFLKVLQRQCSIVAHTDLKLRPNKRFVNVTFWVNRTDLRKILCPPFIRPTGCLFLVCRLRFRRPSGARSLREKGEHWHACQRVQIEPAGPFITFLEHVWVTI